MTNRIVLHWSYFPTSLQGPPNVQSPAAWSAMARLSVWNQSSLSPTELKRNTEIQHAWCPWCAWLNVQISLEMTAIVHIRVLNVSGSPGRECNSDVWHLNLKTVQHIAQRGFAHLCVTNKTRSQCSKKQKSKTCLWNLEKLMYLHPWQRQCVLEPVFPILLRVGVQHYVVHLKEKKERKYKSFRKISLFEI